MNMKKKIVTVCLVACMALTAVAGGTLAYFTDVQSAKNEFVSGNVALTLTEPTWESEGKNNAKLMPSNDIKKDPTITMTGTENAYVLAKIKLSSEMYKVMQDYATEKDESTATVDMMKKWFQGFDTFVAGKKTYTEDSEKTLVIECGEQTKGAILKLFEEVNVPEDMTTAATGKPTVTVVAKAIQAEGFDDADAAYEELVKVSDDNAAVTDAE